MSGKKKKKKGPPVTESPEGELPETKAYIPHANGKEPQMPGIDRHTLIELKALNSPPIGVIRVL